MKMHSACMTRCEGELEFFCEVVCREVRKEGGGEAPGTGDLFPQWEELSKEARETKRSVANYGAG